MTNSDPAPSSIRDDSICESSLPPNKSSGDIGELKPRRRRTPRHGHTVDRSYTPTYHSWQSMLTRARGESWSMSIGGEDVVGHPEWFHEEDYGETQFAAGWMTIDEAKNFIAVAAKCYETDHSVAE